MISTTNRYIRYYTPVKRQPSYAQCGFERENLLIVCTNDMISAINHPQARTKPAHPNSNRDACRSGPTNVGRALTPASRYCPSCTSVPSSITQNADVRFLGKLLGDIIRHLGGQACFKRNRSHTRGVRRPLSRDRQPPRLASGLETLSLDETVAFVRSFMLFSMLANLAEDRQGAAAEEDNTLASALQFVARKA